MWVERQTVSAYLPFISLQSPLHSFRSPFHSSPLFSLPGRPKFPPQNPIFSLSLTFDIRTPAPTIIPIYPIPFPIHPQNRPLISKSRIKFPSISISLPKTPAQEPACHNACMQTPNLNYTPSCPTPRNHNHGLSLGNVIAVLSYTQKPSMFSTPCAEGSKTSPEEKSRIGKVPERKRSCWGIESSRCL